MSMRKRQEVQKVSRRIGLGLCLTASLWAAVLPDQFGPYSRISKGQVDIADRPVWDEYGFQTAERADYQAGERKVSVSVWQIERHDGRSGRVAVAATRCRPAWKLRAPSRGQLHPDGSVAATVETTQSGSGRESEPAWHSYLRSGWVQHSERYVLGPASLAKFEPRISADLAGFHKGAEAQIARYKTEPARRSCFCFLTRPRRSPESASGSSQSGMI